jgi:hypothetical protein
LQNVTRFRPEYITMSLMVLVSIVFLLTFFTGLQSIKEAITYILIIVLLSFLTIDIKNNSNKKKPLITAYKYVVLIFLFSYLTLF